MSLFLLSGLRCVAVTTSSLQTDIRVLNQDFIKPLNETEPWIFVPKENIKSLSTETNPGFVKIVAAGQGKDIKGLLSKPIKIADYPLPWEFQVGFLNAAASEANTEGQYNYAMGINVAVTFSDPSTWPRDRTQMPPDTHSVQLLVTHLGNFGENYRSGVPLLRQSELNYGDSSPEVYLLYGRGDLDPKATGNWRMVYPWLGQANIAGTGKADGPANWNIRFKAQLLNPTSLEIGMGYGQTRGWRSKTIDCSRWGKITGIWEIGPIISGDRWIPDVLADELGLNHPVWLESLKARYSTQWAENDKSTLKPFETLFKVDAPFAALSYYVDYALFHGTSPDCIEQFSDEFDVPGFTADSKYYIEGYCLADTYSNPGYLTMTSLGNNGGWGVCPATGSDGIDLMDRHKPPFEIEIAFIPLSSSKPWNLWWNVGLWDEAHKKYYTWQPTIKNIPGVGCKYMNVWMPDPKEWQVPPQSDTGINPKFDSDIRLPANGEPLRWVLQVMDQYHVRVGYKSDKSQPWTFSKVFDSKPVFGKIGKFGYPALVSYQMGESGMAVGNYPAYQRLLIDYIRYRFGLSQ